ncbi:glycosyltransferase [Planomonospora parontospora]|uniref:glycosyltransferase n=1 Tax=Planomonospora parontospora TaxID=58119 RepID=UPI0016701AAC|nr:glycosyltransferase [Planomonospora parontospora]GGL29996.1 glycosyl transferase [Planomonospora parontospora subsp. antibiotica]GII17760.1 glycosyl transferase [Planomonospora parontospora subsp. antibiotica]
MRVLLSAIGSRGDVQPVVALAVRLRALGEEARVCAPPDFGEWIGGLGVPFTPLGPELRPTGKADPAAPPPSPEQRRRMAEGTIAAQFATLPAAAEGCDVIVAGGYLVPAARSVAERMEIGYVFAGYCPIALPSPHHAPPPLPMQGDAPADGAADNRTLWEEDARRWNDLFGAALNTVRASAGLAPVGDVRSHMLTDRPWLAADPALAPWPGSGDPDVVQTGAWILPDERPLPAELEAFLDAGEPPVYFGFGSVRAPRDLGRNMVRAARAVGRRAVVLRGWADLEPPDDGPDCLSIGEVNQQALFRRVAAAVHHGGAGTTTAAARAGTPQVVVPQQFDQHYWAQRIVGLGAGTAHAPGAPTAGSLAEALDRVLRPEVAARARSVAAAVRTDGAETAARLLADAGARSPS